MMHYWTSLPNSVFSAIGWNPNMNVFTLTNEPYKSRLEFFLINFLDQRSANFFYKGPNSKLLQIFQAISGDLGLIPGLERSPGEGNSYPLQYSGLENSMDSISTGSQRVGLDWATFTFTFIIVQKGFTGGSWVKNLPVMQEMQVWSLGREDSREEEVGNPLQYFHSYVHHIFFIHSSVEGYLGCFHVLAI